MNHWDSAITEVVESLEIPFDSHLVIREVARRNQRMYVQALTELDTDTPFHQLHSSLGRRIKVVCEGLGFIGKDYRSPDIFGQNSRCKRWSR